MKFIYAITVLIFAHSLAGCTYQLRPSDKPQVDSILALAKEILNSSEFRDVLESIPADSFDHTADEEDYKNDDGGAVLVRLLNKSVDGVVCRRAMNPFNFKTNAWEGDGTPQIRCSYLDRRSNEQWVGTIIHEQAHAAGYLHNGNKRQDNQCTVPHVVGDLGVYLAEKARGGDVSLPKDACQKLKEALVAVR